MTFVATSLIAPSKTPIDYRGKTQTLSSAQKLGLAADVVVGGAVLSFALLIILQTGGLVSLGPLAGIGTIGNTAAFAMAGGVGVVVVSDATTLSVTLVRQVKKAEIQVAHIRMMKQSNQVAPIFPIGGQSFPLSSQALLSRTQSMPPGVSLSGSVSLPKKEQPSLNPRPAPATLKRAKTMPLPKNEPSPHVNQPTTSPQVLSTPKNVGGVRVLPSEHAEVNSPGLSPIFPPTGKGRPLPIPTKLLQPQGRNHDVGTPSSFFPTTPRTSTKPLSSPPFPQQYPPNPPPPPSALPPSLPPPPTPAPRDSLPPPATPSTFPPPIFLTPPTTPTHGEIPIGPRNQITPKSVVERRTALLNYEALFTQAFLEGKFRTQIDAVIPLIMADTSRTLLCQAFDGFLSYLNEKNVTVDQETQEFAQAELDDSSHALPPPQEDSSWFEEDSGLDTEQPSYLAPVQEQMDISFDGAPGELQNLFSCLHEYIMEKTPEDLPFAIKGCIALITDTLLKKVEEENTRAAESRERRTEENRLRMEQEALQAEQAKKEKMLEAREGHIKWFEYDLRQLKVPENLQTRIQMEVKNNANLLTPSEANSLAANVKRLYSEIAVKGTSTEMESLLEELKEAGEKLKNFLNAISGLRGQKIDTETWFKENIE